MSSCWGRQYSDSWLLTNCLLLDRFNQYPNQNKHVRFLESRTVFYRCLKIHQLSTSRHLRITCRKSTRKSLVWHPATDSQLKVCQHCFLYKSFYTKILNTFCSRNVLKSNTLCPLLQSYCYDVVDDCTGNWEDLKQAGW